MRLSQKNDNLRRWRGGEVVTLRSAKPPHAGSIPAHASRSDVLAWSKQTALFAAGSERRSDVFV